MKMNYLVSVLLIALTILIGTAPVGAVPANPNPVATTQPDGTPLTVRIFGDEWYHFYESMDGHAIVQSDDGWWWYAELNAEGRYVASTYRLGKQDPGLASFLARTGVHLREDARYQTERRERFAQETMPSILEKLTKLAPEAPTAPNVVTLNVPVVLIQYPDFFASQTPASFSNMMNMFNYGGVASFRDYYQTISYGNLTVNATVVGWYTAPNTRDYYKNGTGSVTEQTRARELVRSAVDRAETGGMNWSPFDNDVDGNVDIVFIVHQGPGAECGANPNFVWSHHWYLNIPGISNLSVTYDGKLVDRYIIQPEISCFGGSHIEIGVFCHEFGHALGLPDLYDINGGSEGVGRWDVMGSGSYGGDGVSPQRPVHMSAWSKVKQGWITPTVPTGDLMVQGIAQVETNPVAYKLWTNGTPSNEYFLVENRQKVGFDLLMPTAGLAIWHIDDNQTGNTDENHKLVDLEEADGLAHLDSQANRGDAGDLYPGGSINRFFNGGTNPNSNDYAGAPTGVCVDDISNPAATMTANLCVSAPNPPDLLIRDCASDVGTEPDNACASNWVQSLDLYIDNNDDGIIDAPIKGVVNHLYVRSWNLGGPATNANIKCWYVNPSVGLNFGMGSPGTQIVDAVTFQSQLDIPVMNNLVPTPGGTGYRKYFNWLIPNPPPNIDHYCIGCVIENAQDPQTSPTPLSENNLAEINYWALSLKAGTQPALIAGESPKWPSMTGGGTTVFRENIRIVNRYPQTTFERVFLVKVEGLGGDFSAAPESAYFSFSGPGETNAVFDIIKQGSKHMDSRHIEFKLYFCGFYMGGPWPPTECQAMNLDGELIHDVTIDSYGPEPVGAWSVQYYKPRGDNNPRPSPLYELGWTAPTKDVQGFPENVRYYEIHASPDSSDLVNPDSTTLVTITGGDDDLEKPGFQYFYYPPDNQVRYFSVRAVDGAENPGVPSPPIPPRTVGVIDNPVSSSGVELYPNAPNPFSAKTVMWFRVSHRQEVKVSVYDLTGRLVMRLSDGIYGSGVHRLEWDGYDVAGRGVLAGIYMVKLQSQEGSDSRKIMLIK